MALNVAVRSFTWLEADVATTTYDVNFGFTPKVLIMFSANGLSADGVSAAPIRGHARLGVAGGTMSSNRRCAAYETLDAVAAADIRGRTEDDGVASTTGTTGLLDIDAEANWPANSVRFIVDVQISGGTDQRFTVLALGGTDIVASTTGVLNEPGATGDQVITTTGVNPSFVIMAGISTTTADQNTGSSGAFWMLGMSDGTRSWVHAMGSDDAAVTMDTVSYMKSGQIVALMPQAASTTIDAEATLASLGTGEFTLNWSSQTAGTRAIQYLAVEVATSVVRVDNLLTQTNTTQFSATGYGMTPAAALFVSACRAESTATTPTATSQFSVGLAESASVRETQGMRDEDNVADSEVTTGLETDEVYINLANGSMQGIMDLVSFDGGGMTLVMDDADPAQSFVGTFAIGAAFSGGGGDAQYSHLPLLGVG